MKTQIKGLIIEMLGIVLMISIGFYFKDLPVVIALLDTIVAVCIVFVLSDIVIRDIHKWMNEYERVLEEKYKNGSSFPLTEYSVKMHADANEKNRMYLEYYGLLGTNVRWNTKTSDGTSCLTEECVRYHLFIFDPQEVVDKEGHSTFQFKLILFKLSDTTKHGEDEMPIFKADSVTSEQFVSLEKACINKIRGADSGYGDDFTDQEFAQWMSDFLNNKTTTQEKDQENA